MMILASWFRLVLFPQAILNTHSIDPSSLARTFALATSWRKQNSLV
jgi:hypothetical protein